MNLPILKKGVYRNSSLFLTRRNIFPASFYHLGKGFPGPIGRTIGGAYVPPSIIVGDIHCEDFSCECTGGRDSSYCTKMLRQLCDFMPIGTPDGYTCVSL